MGKSACKICVMLCLLIAFSGCDPLSEREKLAHRAMYNAINSIQNRYQLQFIGISEGADEHHYNSIGLTFQIFRPLSKDEGREMLINSVEELLKKINADPKLHPFLKPTPFTIANIQLSIFSYQHDGRIVYYPDILIFEFLNGKVQYATKIPEMEFGYYTEESESYEDALNIVRSQENVP